MESQEEEKTINDSEGDINFEIEDNSILGNLFFVRKDLNLSYYKNYMN